MRNRVQDAIQRAIKAFVSFTPGQKAMTIFTVVALGVGGYFFWNWAGTPTYAPLFTNLAPADASAMVDKLTTDGVSYQLADGGATIMVPKESVYAERLKLSAAGLPAQGNAGYALLDKQGTMTSEFMQQVTYRRALEGELAMAVKKIDGVTAATVHLAIPEKNVFADEQQKPTASVLVGTSPGKKLSAEQVQAISYMVAKAVNGLDTDQVTVVGSDGKVLSVTGDGATSGGGELRTQQTKDYESRMNTALQRMLDQALGTGHSVVQVTADLDFDSTSTTTQRYVAEPSTPPLSESKKNETYNGSGTAVGGVLGPDNIQVPVGGAGTPGNYNGSTETRNNAVGMVTEVRKAAPGTVRKMAVAVLLDSAVAKDEDSARLQQLVASAAGLDAARGDTVAVSAMKFDTSAADKAKSDLAESQKAENRSKLLTYAETGAVVLGVLVLIILAILGSRRRKKEVAELTDGELQQLEAMKAQIEQARNGGAIEGGNAGGQAAIAATPEDEYDPEAEQLALTAEREKRQDDIKSLVERQPDEVAQLLRGWLADRRS